MYSVSEMFNHIWRFYGVGYFFFQVIVSSSLLLGLWKLTHRGQGSLYSALDYCRILFENVLRSILCVFFLKHVWKSLLNYFWIWHYIKDFPFFFFYYKTIFELFTTRFLKSFSGLFHPASYNYLFFHQRD